MTPHGLVEGISTVVEWKEFSNGVIRNKCTNASIVD